MRVSDLLAEPRLKLELRTSACRTDRTVTGAHGIELSDPGRWIARGDVVLTTAVALREDPRQLVDFVRSAERAGAPAIGFGEGVVFDRVPPELIEAAEGLAIPVFAVPLAIPFREIVATVLATTLESGYRDLARATALQDFLVESIGASAPRETLVERLAEVLRLPVVLYSPLGEALCHSGRADTDAIWAAVRPGRPVGRIDDDYVLVADVDVGDEPRFVLAVHLVRAARLEGFARALLRFGTRVLQMIATTEMVTASQERTARSQLLRQILRAPEITEALEVQAGSYGVTGSEPIHLLVVAAAGVDGATSSPTGLSELQTLVETALSRMRVPRMTMADVEAGHVLAVAQGDDLSSRFVQAVQELPAGDALLVGVGLPAQDLRSIQQTVREARIALAAAAEMVPERVRLAVFDPLDVANLLLAYLPPTRRDTIAEVLAPLADREDLLETLAAFFAHGNDIAETAAALHLHPNSVRYRLARVEEALGHSFKDPRTLTRLYLALQARAAFGPAPRDDGAEPARLSADRR